MLLLTRKPGEVIRIGDNFSVTLCGIKGNQVRLGFTAPLDVNIVRDDCKKTYKKPKTT